MMKFFIRVVVLLLTCTAAQGDFMGPEPVSLRRLVDNLSAFIEEHPDDAAGYYALGRVHSMAFVTGSGMLDAYRPDDGIGPRNIPDDVSHPGIQPKLVRSAKFVGDISEEERLRHLEQAIISIQRAIEIGFEAEYAAPHLSLAYVLDKGIEFSAKVGVLPAHPDGQSLDETRRAELEDFVEQLADAEFRRAALRAPNVLPADAAPAFFEHRNDPRPAIRDLARESLQNYWKTVAAHHYLAAFDSSIDEELKQLVVMGSYQSLVGYEAGRAYLRLVETNPRLSDEIAIQRVTDGMKQLENTHRGGWVTPIIFSLNDPSFLADLLSPATVVNFDLDGTGRAQRWPWVKPDTAILCWDPFGTGEITSGRQLFGSVTWWLFLPDGYRALDALDDDRNGWLRGDEMVGMAIWRDHNSDGVSDPGELVLIEETDIEAISTRAITTEDGSPANPAGLRLKNGSTLPTYDWIAHSIEDN